MPQAEWFECSRKLSPAIRAQQEAERRLHEILNCDDCQTPEGYSPCPLHPKEYRQC